MRFYDANGNEKVTAPVSTIPSGCVQDYAGSSAPDGWYICDGSSKNTTTDAALFAVIGYQFGGSGVSFNLPNLKGRVTVGIDSGQTEFDVRGETGGAKTHALTAAETATKNHTHSGTTGTVSVGHTHDFTYDRSSNTTTGGAALRVTGIAATGGALGATTQGISANHTHSFTSGNPDGGEANGSAHENMPPYMALHKIIKR